MLQGIKILYGPPTHTSYEGQPFFGLVILRSPLCGSFVWPAGHGYLGCALAAPSAASSHSREFILVGHRSGVALPMPSGCRSNFSLQPPSRKHFYYDNYYDGVREPGGPGVRGVRVQGGCG